MGSDMQADSTGTTPWMSEHKPLKCFLSSVSVSGVLGAAGVHSKTEHQHDPQEHRGKAQLTGKQRAGDMYDLYLCECVCLCVGGGVCEKEWV